MFKLLSVLASLLFTINLISIYDYSYALNKAYAAKIQTEKLAASDRNRMAMLARRAVRISQMCDLGELTTIGSGVVVKKEKGKTLVATANHVAVPIVASGCDMVVSDWQGYSGFASIVKANKGTDIAVIEVSENIGEAAGLYRNPYLGMAVSCVGWPMIPYESIDTMSITRGYVSTMGIGGYMRVSADLYFGNSGGACFSKKGDVVGIVSYFLSTGSPTLGPAVPRPGQYFISDVRNLKNMLDS